MAKFNTLTDIGSFDEYKKVMVAVLKGFSVGRKGAFFCAGEYKFDGGKKGPLLLVDFAPALLKPLKENAAGKIAEGHCTKVDADGLSFEVTKGTAGDAEFLKALKNLGLSWSVEPAMAAEEQAKASWVADWAKEEYQREAKRTLIASMTPDGKIGSVYFAGAGRIRTTHAEGPAREKHQGSTVQLNVNGTEAEAEHAKKYAPSSFPTAEDYWDHYDAWLVGELEGIPLRSAPKWATVVDSPDRAHDLRSGSPPADVTLVEIFKNINGVVEAWHPSRGIAAKFETDKQTISVLEAAIKYIDDPAKHLDDPQQRNVAFYNFVKSRLPTFVQNIRDPSQVVP